MSQYDKVQAQWDVEGIANRNLRPHRESSSGLPARNSSWMLHSTAELVFSHEVFENT